MRMTEPVPDELAQPLAGIDLYDPARYATSSQHDAWHRLRRDAPVWPQETADGIRFWSVTRYRDVAGVLMDDKNFSSAYGTILAVAGGDSAGGQTINLMDQPRHADVRLPAMRLMSTHAVRNRAEQVRQRVRQLVAGCFDTGGVVDVAALMLHLPMAAVGETIGLPEPVWADLPRWAMAGVAPEDPQYADGTPAQTLRKAHHRLIEVFSDLVRHKQAHPGDDVVSVLLGLDFGGRPMDPHEVLLNCYSFAMGAVTTTAQVASHLVLALAERPAAWQLLRRWRSITRGHVTRWRRACGGPRRPTTCCAGPSLRSRSPAPGWKPVSWSRPGWRRPTGTRACSPTRTASTRSGRTIRIWPSGSARTAASAGRRPNRCSGCCWRR